MRDSAVKSDDGKSVKLFYYDKQLRMYLPSGGKSVQRSEIEIDSEAETPKDMAGLSFFKIKGRRLYIAASEAAKA